MEKNRYTGLTQAEAEQSRQQFGNNVLTPPEKEPLWKKFLGKFADPLIIILLFAGLFSLGISCYEYFYLDEPAMVFFEPVGIFIAILLATGMAFYFEYRADQEFAILNQVNDAEAVRVIREGNTIEIPKSEVVIGDLVRIGTGDDIPADGQLIEATKLQVDESTLTGEPICSKTIVETEFDEHATFPSNMVMRGTKVMEGHGLFCVSAVGDRTENGKVFVAAQIDNSIKTPLNEQLERLGSLISKLSYTIACLIVVGRIALYLSTQMFDTLHFITYLLQTVMIAVTLVVVAVPEGLPMAVTLSLAYSMRRMLKTNNLVRKMHACETMGATTVICTDKTGTLTQNQMRIHETRFYGLDMQQLTQTDEGKLVIEGLAVNSTASLDKTDANHPKVLGNPTEGALLLWLDQQQIDFETLRQHTERVEELPFSTERKYMATVVRSSMLPGKQILYVKGAPEIVYSHCRSIWGNVSKTEMEAQLLAYQNQAMRTLGFAYQLLEEGEKGITDGKVTASSLTFMGVIAIADPVRADVPAAVNECIEAGIHIKIVTGDTPATAREIGRQIGLWKDTDTDDQLITGPEFAALSDETLRRRIRDIKIIARARPMDKKRLVETLQELNEVVAVTGDGTNDAPALKAAHVGLSMGDGTSVAKEASDITIIDNSFTSIGRAVMWGRSLYQNIQRFILFQLTVNVAACLIVLAGAFMGTESPLTVTQMLWVNLIMDTFAAMALASLPPSMAVMKNQPRDRKAFIINASMKSGILFTGIGFFAVLFGLLYIFQHTDITSLTDFASLDLSGGHPHLSRYESSLLFTIFVMLQFWNMFNARAYHTGRSAFHFKGCTGFISIAVLILIGQIIIVTFGGQMFNVAPLHLTDWIVIVLVTALVLIIGEAGRALRRKAS